MEEIIQLVELEKSISKFEKNIENIGNLLIFIEGFN